VTTSRKALVGAFVIGGVLLFALGLFWIGDRRLLFSDSIELYTEFANLSSLKVGAKTFVSGMDAGEVLGIQVPGRPGEKFRVHFRVLEDFRPLMRQDSIASIQVEGLVGSKVLQVESGTSNSPPVPSGATIPSREPVEIAQIIQQSVDTLNNVNDAIQVVQGHTVQALDTVDELGQEAIKVTLDVGRDARELFATGNAIAKDVNTVVADVRQGRGTIGKLFTDEGLYERAGQVAADVKSASADARALSADVRQIVADLKSRNVGENLAKTTANVEQITSDARQLLAGLQKGGDSSQRSLMADVKDTLENTREATADLAENLEALKRNWLFRGFFNSRGFYDLNSISPAEYARGTFAPERERERSWVHAPRLFTTGGGGEEVLSDEGKKRLDLIAAPYLRIAANTPLIVEGYAGEGSETEQFLRSRDRARLVRHYFIQRFDLSPTYIGAVPMGAVRSSGPSGEFFEGVGIVYFPEKVSRARQ
jgi:phospholipid/cholesterol/gamma-HCH transport system substrate-binding protein